MAVYDLSRLQMADSGGVGGLRPDAGIPKGSVGADSSGGRLHNQLIARHLVDQLVLGIRLVLSLSTNGP